MWCGWRTVTAGSDGSTTVYLGLGSNVGDRRALLASALQHIAALARIDAISGVYETEPVGYREQPEFWNLVVRVTTVLPPGQLLAALKRVEQQAGRTPSFAGGPREIDIDLLLYGDRIIVEPDLQVPHPRMLTRGFVLVPLAELAKDLRIPGEARRIEEILAGGEFERVQLLFPGEELLR